MKRGNKLLMLTAVFVVVCIAAAVAARLNPDNQEETEAEGTSIFQLDADSAESLSWTQGDETVSLVMEDSTWKNADDADFPVKQSIPETMTETLSDMQATKTIDDVDDLSEYGLDEPSCTVTVKAGDTESTLLIGDETGLGGSRYLSLDEGTTVYLVDSSIYDSFSYGLYDIVQTEDIPSMSDVTSFTIESDNQTLALTATEVAASGSSEETESTEDSGSAESTEEDEEETETVWTSGGETLDSTKAEELVSEITGLSWNSCVDTHASEKLADYGLDAPVKVTVEYTEDGETQSFSLEIGSTSDDGCYARISDSELVYLIDADIRETLTSATLDSLIPEEDETTAAEEETAAEETSETTESTVAEETAETAETAEASEAASTAETASAAETTATDSAE